MKKYFVIGIVAILFLAVGLVVYGGYLNYTDERKIAERLQDERIEVQATTVRKIFMRNIYKLDAVRLYAEGMADATLLVNGNIVAWHVKKNDYVNKGDLLVTLKNEQIALKIEQSKSALSRAEASLAQATNAYNRQGRLMARNATSKEKYEESEAQYNAAKAAVAESQTVLSQNLVEAERLNVYAPVDGNVLIMYSSAGAYLQAGAPVALIGNFQNLRFSTTMDDVTKNALHVGDKVSLKFSKNALKKAYDTEYAAGNVGFGENIEATLVEITPPLEEKATMRRLVWEVDNRAGILEPLTYHDVEIINRTSYECLAIPERALSNNDSAVFVVDENGILEKRKVKIGATDGVYFEILDGLKQGEVVVIGSFDGLTDGTKVNLNLES